MKDILKTLNAASLPLEDKKPASSSIFSDDNDDSFPEIKPFDSNQVDVSEEELNLDASQQWIDNLFGEGPTTNAQEPALSAPTSTPSIEKNIPISAISNVTSGIVIPSESFLISTNEKPQQIQTRNSTYFQDQVPHLIHTVADKNLHIADLEKQMKEKNRKIILLSKRNKELNADTEYLTKDNEALMEKVYDLKDQLRDQLKNSPHKQLLTKANQQNKNLTRLLKEAQTENTSLKAELETLKNTNNKRTIDTVVPEKNKRQRNSKIKEKSVEKEMQPPPKRRSKPCQLFSDYQSGLDRKKDNRYNLRIRKK